ncbi:MAG: TylF/MycF/NovP-related O-methyltransferase [Gammaproteobacteria bacterium]
MNKQNYISLANAFIKLIVRHDPLDRFEMLRCIARFLVPEYRFKWPQMAWWNDSLFNEYLIRFDELDGMNTDRRWMLHQLLRMVADIPGDTAECGVYKGAGSYLICLANRENQKFARTHYIFDSFEGLSEPLDCDGGHWKQGDLSSPLESLQNGLSDFQAFSIHKGWIPSRFQDIEARSFCFVHIDVDLFRPTLDSIEFFYPRMNHGGIILCDDYGCTSCPGATSAVDQFLEDKIEKMVALSDGGGFFIKGTETSNPVGC